MSTLRRRSRYSTRDGRLTVKQDETLAEISAFIKREKRPIKLREIQALLGLSLATTKGRLQMLVRGGVLRHSIRRDKEGGYILS